MSTGGESGHLHRTPEGTVAVTRRSGYTYFVYDKHHGHGGRGDSQWAEALGEADEFGIFDLADAHDIADDNGNLYGLWLERRKDGPPHFIRDLGTKRQQVAKFWYTRPNQPWHGFPFWPLDDASTPNRAKQRFRPPKDVFRAMEDAQLIDAFQRRRFQKGSDANE